LTYINLFNENANISIFYKYFEQKKNVRMKNKKTGLVRIKTNFFARMKIEKKMLNYMDEKCV